MSRHEVDQYFERIGKWMKNDIKREIELARVSRTSEGRASLEALGIPAGGGNLLAALGLVAYTEALGSLRAWNRTKRYGNEPDYFNAFFDRMAHGRYKSWWAEWKGSLGKSAYVVLRNGLVHEYRPKVRSEFHIGEGEDFGFGEKDGVLVFRIEPYYEDFCSEMAVLHAELAEMRNPEAEIPPPSGMPRPSDSGTSFTSSAVASGPAFGSAAALESFKRNTVKPSSEDDDNVG